MCSIERRAEAKDATVATHKPVATARVVCGHAHDRSSQRLSTHRAVEARVAEGEDPTIASHEPIALVVGCACHPVDRLVEGEAAGGAEERCPESKDAPVGSHFPIPTGGIVSGDAYNGFVQM